MTGDFYALMKRVMVLEETVQRLSDLYEGMKEEIEEIEEIEPSVTYRRCKCGRMNMLPGIVVSYTADGAHSPDECKPWEFARVLQGHTGGQKKPEPPGCPACDGVAGTECRCDSRECCTDGTCESCAPLMAWFDYRKDYEPNDTVTAAKHFHAGRKAAQWHYQTDPVAEPVTCACGKEALPPEFEKVTDSQYTRTTHASHACWSVSPLFHTPAPVPQCHECGAPATHMHPVPEGMHQVWTCDEHFGVICCEPLSEPVPDDDPPPDDPLYDAWCLIANAPVQGWAFSGYPTPEGTEWIEAAKRWRNAWHETIKKTPDPAPVPEWRRLADAGVRNLAYTHEDPLVVVLRSLSNIANPKKDTSANLARIIAIAEREVGDGWQVEPDLIRMCHPDRRDRCDLDCLIDALTKDGESRWTVLGGRTAAWLKAITEDEAS